MNILIVNSFYYPNMVGGTEQSVKLLAEGLTNKGHNVYILTADSSEIKEKNGVKIIRLDLKTNHDNILKKIARKTLEFRNFYIEEKIKIIIDKIQPDVIHTNNLFYISPIIWKIAKGKNINVIHTLRDYWGICPKTTLLRSKGEICIKKKCICNIHKYNYTLYSQYVDTVTSPSKFTLDLYKKNNIFKNSKNIVIQNAIDFDINKRNKLLNQKFARNSEKILFLFIGTLDVHKGIKFLIESFKAVKNENIILNICGDGPLKSYVEENCKIDKRINYLGKVLKDKKEEVLNSSDVMIVPSIWYEPFGRVVIEAYKYAMPVIGSEIGGISELLDRNISLKIKPNINIDLIDSIEKLSNRDNIKKYIKNINKDSSIVEKYNLDNQIKAFEIIYSSVERNNK